MHNLIYFLVFFTLVACSGNWSQYPASQSGGGQETVVVRIGDVVTMTVFGENEVSGDYEVLADGTLNIPLAGNVNVAGKTINEAESAIKAEFIKGGYLLNPKILIAIPQNHNVYILGEVVVSGEYVYRPGMTILDLVATAKGFSYRANQDKFDIIRRNADGSETHLLGDIATRLMPDDTVRVRERYF